MANANMLMITLDIDGTLFKQDIEERAKREVVADLKKQIEKAILQPSYYGYSSNSNMLQTWVRDYIKEVIITEHKDEIIRLAAINLADSMRRSKPVRERFCDILGEELEEES